MEGRAALQQMNINDSYQEPSWKAQSSPETPAGTFQRKTWWQTVKVKWEVLSVPLLYTNSYWAIINHRCLQLKQPQSGPTDPAEQGWDLYFPS